MRKFPVPPTGAKFGLDQSLIVEPASQYPVAGGKNESKRAREHAERGPEGFVRAVCPKKSRAVAVDVQTLALPACERGPSLPILLAAASPFRQEDRGRD